MPSRAPLPPVGQHNRKGIGGESSSESQTNLRDVRETVANGPPISVSAIGDWNSDSAGCVLLEIPTLIPEHPED